MAKRTYSTIIDRDEVADSHGQRPYNREQIYRWMYENSDHRGIIIYSQREVAKRIDIGYQAVCQIYGEMAEMGLLKKHGARFYEVVYDPDEIEWNAELRSEAKEARQQFQYYKFKQKGVTDG